MDKDKKNLRTIKIQTITKVGMVVGVVLLLTIFIALFSVLKYYNALIKNVNLFAESQAHIYSLQSSSDHMTERVRLYVITQDPQYVEDYFITVDDEYREEAFLNLQAILKDDYYTESLQIIENALNNSNSLMDEEIHAMNLISQINGAMDSMPDVVKEYQCSEKELAMSDAEKRDAAYYLVYGQAYREKKEVIDAGTAEAIRKMADLLKIDAIRSAEDLRGSINTMMASAVLMFVLVIAVFIAIIVLVIHPLKVMVKCIEENRAFDIIGAYEFQYLALTYNNILEIDRENRERMQYDIEHDRLTGLFNSYALDARKELLAQVQNPIGLIVINADNFKEINELYGRERGDESLMRIADTLRSFFRSGDIIARTKADEFAVILPNVNRVDKQMLGNKIEKINELLSNPLGTDVKVTISAGIAFSPTGFSDELQSLAEGALLEAKEEGKGKYKFSR